MGGGPRTSRKTGIIVAAPVTIQQHVGRNASPARQKRLMQLIERRHSRGTRHGHNHTIAAPYPRRASPKPLHPLDQPRPQPRQPECPVADEMAAFTYRVQNRRPLPIGNVSPNGLIDRSHPRRGRLGRKHWRGFPHNDHQHHRHGQPRAHKPTCKPSSFAEPSCRRIVPASSQPSSYPAHRIQPRRRLIR